MINLLHLKIVGKGPPLVLLHGWGWHSGIWSPLIPQLADNFQLFIPDLPGFGKSPVLTEHYTFEGIASHLFATIPTQAAWLGWSLGGLFAWWVAIHYPEKISRLLTVAASPKFVQAENWPGIPFTTLERFAVGLTSHYEATLQDFLTLQLRGSNQQQALMAALKAQFLPPDKLALCGGLELLRTTDLRKDLHKVAVPSLHLFGSLDTIVPIQVVNHLPPLWRHGQSAVMPRTGHIPFLTQPEKFVAVVKMFLQN